MNKNVSINQDFLDDIKGIINNARQNAVRSVDFCRVQMYWNIGRRIFKEEQDGKERADYGSYLLKNLATELVPEYGSGFSIRQLEQSRQFYRTYPIANAVRSQLNWTQYRRLIQIEDPDLGQLQMYVNYYDRCVKLQDEHPTIGILLGTSKNDTVVKMTLPEDNKTILANEYKLYLPTKSQLIKEINDVISQMENEEP